MRVLGLLDTVAAVVLGLGLVHVPVLVVAEDIGAGILAAGRMVAACLGCPCQAGPYLSPYQPCRPPYPCPFLQAKTLGPYCLFWELWGIKLFECEVCRVERCYGSWRFAAIGETVGSVLRLRKHGVNGVNGFAVMSCDDHENVS